MSAEFDDGKDDGALRTIGEVSKALDIKTHVLRYWEQQFPMLQPLKRSGGRRYYRSEDVELVETIDRLVNRQGYTLKGARQVIEDGSADAVTDAAPVTQAKEPVEPAPAPVVDAPVAQDGGLSDFFGKPSEPATSVADTRDAADADTSSPEVVAKLKDIRAKLAAALES
ncbi:MerR family transcriptional regulator [Erythrobacter sp. HKB08]|uniref:MerR family transcriptional regulator n=1 Tax=Erythrobacter sp. HKB08 TaxID=2502843 RepID=UPI001008D22A|nr:MerR family transcriptional regulator [Erythrobacter sp. HKB08]